MKKIKKQKLTIQNIPLPETPKPAPVVVVEDEVVETGLVVVAKKPVQPEVTTAQSLNNVFDRYQKKIYLFDVSGSMRDGMAPEDEAELCNWTPEVLTRFREAIRDEQIEEAEDAENADLDDAEDEADDFMAEEGLDDDAKLKAYIIEKKLGFGYYPAVQLEKKSGCDLKTERKIDSVKGAMTRFIEQRFRKYPEAQVGVLRFSAIRAQRRRKCLKP
jgi:hypothetical protein